MLKNTASQKIAFFAFDYATGAPKTGDAANLTPYVNIDWGGVTAITDTSLAELSSSNAPGWYVCDLTQAETNGNCLHFTCKSATGDVAVIGHLIFTNPTGYHTLASQASVDAIDDILDTEFPALVTAVADLPTNAELATALGTADDAVLTAIGDLPTNAELATALGTADDAVLAQVALVKAKTDLLTFTVANQLDANVESINGAEVLGDGSSGDLWRG